MVGSIPNKTSDCRWQQKNTWKTERLNRDLAFYWITLCQTVTSGRGYNLQVWASKCYKRVNLRIMVMKLLYCIVKGSGNLDNVPERDLSCRQFLQNTVLFNSQRFLPVDCFFYSFLILYSRCIAGDKNKTGVLACTRKGCPTGMLVNFLKNSSLVNTLRKESI